jgi:hypothetical protein
MYSTVAFASGGGGGDDCSCCAPCMSGVMSGLWWTFCLPCACHKQSAEWEADAKKRDDEREAYRRFEEKWEAKSEKLCWACSYYFRPLLASEYDPRGKRFGYLNEIVERAERCICCSFLVQLSKEYSASSMPAHLMAVMPAATTSWGGFEIRLATTMNATNQTLKLYHATNPSTSKVNSEATHVVKSKIDWRVPRSWLQACRRRHADSCENRWKLFFDASLKPPGMRLVDVNKLTIFMLPTEPADGRMVRYKYAVLSYTWGGVEKTKIENPSRREIDLAPYHQQLPQTIKDAIVTTREMGLDFLWVDALCIQSRVEGDEAAMKADEDNQVQDMHQIYGQACFCIVAAGGESANDGLWSAARDPESKQATVPTRPEFVPPESVELDDSTSLTIVLPLPGDISKCKWASRAWCLQEQLFSTRYLVFFDNQIYFQCKKGMWFEDMSLGKKQFIHGNKSKPVLGQIKDINIDFSILEKSTSESQNDHVENVDGTLTVVRSPIFTEYQSIVSLYSTREMTNPDDAINAIDGLLSVIKVSMHTDTLFGLPESMLDAALLWRGEEALEPRGRGTQTTDAALPSWSWAGWKGYVGYDKPVEYDRKRRKFVQLEPSRGKARSYPEYIGPFVLWYKSLKYPDSIDTPDGAFGKLAPVNDTGLGTRMPKETLPDNWPLISKMPTYQDALAEQKSSAALEPTHLHLLTMCVEDFELTSKLPGTSTVSDQQRYICLTSDDGTPKVVGEVVGELWHDENTRQQNRKEPNEALVVISSARYFKTPRLNETLAVYDHIPGCYLYNVLLVEFVEKVKMVSNIMQKYKVAYRKGIGRITKEDWRVMNPKVEFIRLG